MSVRAEITWFCDKCGAVLKQYESSSIGVDKINRMRSDFQSDLRSSGGMISPRFHGSTVHYCHACADGAPLQTMSEGCLSLKS